MAVIRKYCIVVSGSDVIDILPMFNTIRHAGEEYTSMAVMLLEGSSLTTEGFIPYSWTYDDLLTYTGHVDSPEHVGVTLNELSNEILSSLNVESAVITKVEMLNSEFSDIALTLTVHH